MHGPYVALHVLCAIALGEVPNAIALGEMRQVDSQLFSTQRTLSGNFPELLSHLYMDCTEYHACRRRRLPHTPSPLVKCPSPVRRSYPFARGELHVQNLFSFLLAITRTALSTVPAPAPVRAWGTQNQGVIRSAETSRPGRPGAHDSVC
jgi:hypothetical protein